MKIKNFNLENAKNMLGREEMKKVMGGKEGPPKCTVSTACSKEAPVCSAGCTCVAIGDDYYCNG